MIRPITLRENIRPIMAAIRTVPIPPRPGAEAGGPPPLPFITISREAGAGAWTLAHELVPALNATETSDPPWTCWDKELVEKVAADHHLSQTLIESLEEANHSWLSDFLASLSFSDESGMADEARVYGRVAATIRALAQAGHVIIVGRGGVFLTRHMPGGIHVRLVAPLEYRIDFVARLEQLSKSAAVARVREMERHRQGFYHRYWPQESLAPETFTLVLNTASMDGPMMVEAITAAVKHARLEAAV